MNDQVLHFLYRFLFDDEKTIEFAIEIDKNTLNFIPIGQCAPPSWADLSYHQCSNCTLSKTESPHCPVAVNLIPLLDLCGTLISYKTVDLEVVTAERTISGKTTIQRALSSLLGLIMATSPCPHTEYLKPMARFHLPLASDDETIYRSTSMFLLAQYFRYKDNLPHSFEFDELTDRYKNLQIVNKALAQRFRAAISEDATVNAIILLDLLSRSVTWSIEDGLEEISVLFKSYGIKQYPRDDT
ncbi:MAG: hypothetical protein Kow0065_00830 [Methylomicrobium sp.]